jgi:hypothetical protein
MVGRQPANRRRKSAHRYSQKKVAMKLSGSGAIAASNKSLLGRLGTNTQPTGFAEINNITSSLGS